MKKNIPIIMMAIVLVCALANLAIRASHKINDIKKELTMTARYRAYYNLTKQWLENNIAGVGVSSYFDKNNYKTVAVYGLGTLGELFYKQLKNDGVNICCFIDKISDSFHEDKDGIPIVAIDEFVMYKPDVVVVTPMYDFDEIYDNLSEFNNGSDIVSIDDVFLFTTL